MSVPLRWIDGTDVERRAGDEQLDVFRESHSCLSKEFTVLPAKGRQRVSFPSEAVIDNVPLKLGNANMTLHLG